MGGSGGGDLVVPVDPTAAFAFQPHSHASQMSSSTPSSSPPSSPSSPPSSPSLSTRRGSFSFSSSPIPVTILSKPSASSVSLVFTISMWYISATFANSLNKVILTHFPYAGLLFLFFLLFLLFCCFCCFVVLLFFVVFCC